MALNLSLVDLSPKMLLLSSSEIYCRLNCKNKSMLRNVSTSIQQLNVSYQLFLCTFCVRWKCIKILHLCQSKRKILLSAFKAHIGKFCHTQACSSEGETKVMCGCDKRRRHWQWQDTTLNPPYAHTLISITSIPRPGSVLLSLCSERVSEESENTEDTGWRQRKHRYDTGQTERERDEGGGERKETSEEQTQGVL